MQLVPISIHDGRVEAIAVTYFPAYGDGEGYQEPSRLQFLQSYLEPQIIRITGGGRLKGKQKREAIAYQEEQEQTFWRVAAKLVRNTAFRC